MSMLSMRVPICYSNLRATRSRDIGSRGSRTSPLIPTNLLQQVTLTRMKSLKFYSFDCFGSKVSLERVGTYLSLSPMRPDDIFSFVLLTVSVERNGYGLTKHVHAVFARTHHKHAFQARCCRRSEFCLQTEVFGARHRRLTNVVPKYESRWIHSAI